MVKRYLYEATKASGVVGEAVKAENIRALCFVEGKRYRCFEQGSRISCSGFFAFFTKKKPTLVYATILARKSICKQYLKFIQTIENETNTSSRPEPARGNGAPGRNFTVTRGSKPTGWD